MDKTHRFLIFLLTVAKNIFAAADAAHLVRKQNIARSVGTDTTFSDGIMRRITIDPTGAMGESGGSRHMQVSAATLRRSSDLQTSPPGALLGDNTGSLGSWGELLPCQNSSACGSGHTVEALEERGVEVSYLPDAFLQEWRHGCSSKLASEALSTVADIVQSMPACTDPVSGKGYPYPVGTVAVELQRDLWKNRASCRSWVDVNPDDGSDWQWVQGQQCAKRGWECLVAPVGKTDSSRRSSVPADCPVLPESVLHAAIRQDQPDVGFWLVNAAFAELATRPSAEVETWAAAHRRELHQELSDRCASKPKISMHVRQGDRCVPQEIVNPDEPQGNCDGLDSYLKPLQDIRAQYGSCAVLLATDSHRIVDSIDEPNSPLADFHVTLMDLNRTAFAGDPKCEPQPSCQFVENRGKNLGTNISDFGVSLVADLNLLADGDIFLGGFDTNIGRLVYLKMAARSGVLPPFYHYQRDQQLLAKSLFSAGEV